MSHLFKKNYKKIYKFFIISIFFIIIALSYLGLQKYSGNKINYLSGSLQNIKELKEDREKEQEKNKCQNL